MNDALTSEEYELLANFHLNKIDEYLFGINKNMSTVGKKPNIKFIENSIDLIKRELEIVKFYKDKIEKANDN